MAISEVAGSTVSTAFASTQLNSAQRGAEQGVQSSSEETAEGPNNTDDGQSVTAAASSSGSSSGSTGDPSRGTRLNITV